MSNEEFCKFFNDNELFSTWFLNRRLGKKAFKKYRSLLDENIFRLNWRTSMGVTVDWHYAGRFLKDAHIIKDNGRYKSVFLDFMDSKLQKGCYNSPENYDVVVYNDSVDKVFHLPHSAIMTYWSAGWPRHGWNPGRYVIEPWELLKPIGDYLEGSISYMDLHGITFYKKYYSTQKVFDFVYANIYPMIRNNYHLFINQEQVWKQLLRQLYESAIDINKEQFRAAYSPKNPYTGPLERTFPFSWFDDPERMKNPFLVFYREIRTEYLNTLANDEDKEKVKFIFNKPSS
jgi:hypothetical protein